MHVIFVCYYSFASNSAGHIACLANDIARKGTPVTVFVPFDKEKASVHGEVLYDPRRYDEMESWLASHRLNRSDAVIVAWTPRENVRKFVEELRSRVPFPYFVHLEDNERVLTAVNLGVEYEVLDKMPDSEIDSRMSVDERLSHPRRFPRFLARAAGITMVIDSLSEFVAPGQAAHVFWPGYNPTFFRYREIDHERRRELGIGDRDLLLAYTGNVHSANRQEVLTLYLAVAVLNRCGIPTRLVRTGRDYVPVAGPDLEELRRNVVSLGEVATQGEVAAVTSLADVLVQPGRAGKFNDYRFPSKIPEFFAQGRPVLIPDSNLGRFVRDGEDCLVLRRGDAFEIADRIRGLCEDRAQFSRLGKNALSFAQRHFQWGDIATGYLEFLRRTAPIAT